MSPANPDTYCEFCGLEFQVRGCKPGVCLETGVGVRERAWKSRDELLAEYPPPGLTSPLAMQAFPPSSLPMTTAGRMALVMEWLGGHMIYDDEGEPTGEYTEPLITKEEAARLLAEVDESAPPSTPGVSVEEKP